MESILETLISHQEFLKKNFPFFGTYMFNEFQAPHLSGGSPVDLGIAMLFIEELGNDAITPKMSKLLSVTELTCKNWIKKLSAECLCNIEFCRSARMGKRYIVHTHGIFNMELYDQFRPYVKLVIHYWQETLKNGHTQCSGSSR
jgi:hypothetical protein